MPPEGTVTLLMTDIEGSTRLLQDLGEAYEGLLTEHRRLLRSLFEKNQGVVVDTQGDAFLVAFRRARDAVITAVQTQQALAENDQSGSARPRVRIAIHTGEPSQVGEGYIGLALHRLARICSAGHGGQVLLSATTRDLIEDHLPPGVAFIDLGEHRLKDLDRPERIVHLVIEGIPPVFTSLKTLEDQPADPTPFTGREEELAAVAEDAIERVSGKELGALARRKTAAKARALDWRQFLHTRGHSRFANRLEGLGLSIHSTARIASSDVQAELRVLGRALVTAGRDARSADWLLRNMDKPLLARRMAQERRSAYLEHHLRGADKLAAQIDALGRLAEARRDFEREARKLEPTIRGVRARVFDARLDSATLEELLLDVRSLRDAVEVLTVTFHTAYERASRASAGAER